VANAHPGPPASPRWVTEAALWRLLADPVWDAFDDGVRRAVLVAAAAPDETAMASGIAQAVSRDPERLRPVWRRCRDSVIGATRGEIGLGADPSPGHYWWRCPVAGCETPSALGSSDQTYLGDECPAHGALDGPFAAGAGHG
jgi:hypothetical protein